MEVSSEIREHLPQKTTEGIKSEMVLLEFCRKVSQRLSSDISKTIEKCEAFYNKIKQVHEKCHIHLVPKITDLWGKYQHMAHLQDRLQEDIEYIIKIEHFNEEYINHFVGKASINIDLLEDMCKTAAE